MKIGIFDPYLDTLGGGERYILTIASCLANSHEVFVFWDDKKILSEAKDKLGITLNAVKVAENIFSEGSFIKKMMVTNTFDVIIFLSDGSIPFLFAKKNILLFQFPINWVDTQNFMTKLKLRKIKTILCYSDFVKRNLEKKSHLDAKVLPPAIDIPVGLAKKKENIILSVGRFTKAMNTKKHEFLIDTFKQHNEQFVGWRLVIVGSYLPQDKNYVTSLQERAKGYAIEIESNVSYAKLLNYYEKAKIYWHAAGFGEDLEKYPQRAEHFGITTVEAMRMGAVPVVINAGGQNEIVTDGKDGFLWESKDELIKKTRDLIVDKSLFEELAEAAKERSKEYSVEAFCKKIQMIVTT